MTHWRVDFEISCPYNEKEIEDLFAVLEGRGADYVQGKNARVHLYVPYHWDYMPFYQTLLDCSSVGWVDTNLYPVNFTKPETK